MDIEMDSKSFPLQKIFANLAPILNNQSPFCQNAVNAQEYFQFMESYEILVVGAGGLGCQIVKNLALMGLRNIHLIDMDTIDLTNLNRQFLFRQKDVNRYKADVVAEFIMRRCPWVKVFPHKKRIQELPFSFYEKFNIIIGGLDNIQARKYLNNIVFTRNLDSLQQTQCFYIDGATEGFEGQALLVQPFKTSCYQCSLFEGAQNKIKANLCTIAHTPRTPEHCVQYVLEILWEKQFGEQKRDNDNLQHMSWVYQKSRQRADQFKIEGVTEMLVMGVAKNIIPATASTNALIASICTNQAFKVLTNCNPRLNNYILYKGSVSVGSDTIASQRRQNCQACAMRENKLQTLKIIVNQDQTISQLMEKIKQTHKYIQFSIMNHRNIVFLNSADKQRYEKKLSTTFKQLVEDNKFNRNGEWETFYLTDNSLKSELKVQVRLQQ